MPGTARAPDALALLADALGHVGSALGSALGAAGAGLAAAGGALLGALAALVRAVAGALAGIAALLGTGLAWWAGSMARSPRNAASVALGGLAYALHARGILAPLFSRLERHELLQNEARQRIFSYVKERPGAHLSEIAGAMQLGWGTTVYHLNRLVDGQLLTARKVGNQLCHFVNGEGRTAQEQTALAATKAPKAQAIVDFLALRGPSSQSAIAQELGMSGALVSWHAKRLEELGVVQRARHGRTSVLTLRLPVPARPARTLPAARPAEPVPVAA
jgi:DNA-binding MarR family transcriptional regulator